MAVLRENKNSVLLLSIILWSDWLSYFKLLLTN